jgi:hypothetical protein
MDAGVRLHHRLTLSDNLPPLTPTSVRHQSVEQPTENGDRPEDEENQENREGKVDDAPTLFEANL